MEIWNDYALLLMRVAALVVFWQLGRAIKDCGKGAVEVEAVFDSVRKIKRIIDGVEAHVSKAKPQEKREEGKEKKGQESSTGRSIN